MIYYVYDGQVSSGIDLYNDEMYIYDGGVANETTANEYGSLYVSSGGVANSTTVNGGVMYVYYGGSANSTTVRGWGNLYVSNGGEANSTTVNSYGRMYVSSGGSANSTTVNGGVMYVYYGGSANSTVMSGGYLDVYNGGVANETTVNSGGYLDVDNGGVANSTTVNSGGSMDVDNGGVANSTTVNSGGRLHVSGIAYNVTVSAGGILGCFSWNHDRHWDAIENGSAIVANNVTIVGDKMCVYSGGVANSTTVNKWGDLYVYSGGVANSTTVNEGDMYVSNGGVANSTTVNSYGRMYVSSGGVANSTTVNEGDMYVHNGGVVNSTTVNGDYGKPGYLYISRGGVANSTTVNSEGYLYVSLGGSANSTTVNSGGSMNVSLGGAANSTTVNSYGSLCVSRGGTATAILENGGYVAIADGAKVTFVANVLNNMTLTGAATLHSGTTANSTTVNEWGDLYVYSGGVANSTTVNGGVMYVYYGGSANSTTVRGWGNLYVSNGGEANSTTVNSYGRMYVSSGGSANSTTVNGGVMYVYYGGSANSTTVNSRGSMYVSSGGAANSTTVNDGVMYVYYGGSANSTTVNSVGRLVVSRGGVANSTTVNSGGSMFIFAGGKITGTLTIENGAIVSAYNGSAIDFDLSTVAPDDAARVNDLSLIQGSPDFTITVSVTQAAGTYVLASGATGFDGTITVNAETGTTLGTLTVGGELISGNHIYSLVQEDGVLSLTVTINVLPPDAPVAQADITVPTNQNVSVTAVFTDDSVQKQYSFDNTTWETYTAAVLMISNGTVYFRGIDEVGNISEVTEYAVTNIDKEAPDKPTAAASTTAPTNGDVTVTATFSDDSAQKQYSFDGEVWQNYTDGVVMSSNGTVYFRGIDAVGNVSDVASYEVANIDKDAPVITLTGDNTSAVYQTALTAAVDDGSKLYYRIDGSDWFEYTAPITVSVNAVYDFKATDEAGNIGVASMTFSNLLPAVPEGLVGSEYGVSWSPTGVEQYVIEYSADGFEHAVSVATANAGVDSFNLPSGTYSWRVRSVVGDAWAVGDDIVSDNSDPAAKVVCSDADGIGDIFFAVAGGKWGAKYAAQHLGTVGGWAGTKETVKLDGKNKLADIFEGSTDANVLLLTDDANGDALFVDDIYTALPGTVAEQQARIARFDEVRAGAGDDVVDMTSQRFAYTGDGLTVRGGDGNDTIWANRGDNRLFGDAGSDRLVGASGNDVLVGGIGNDSMHGGGGNDVFCFCGNWGDDTVEQLADGTVTLWFVTGDEANWNAATLTYADGINSVTVRNVAVDSVTLKFGDDGSEQYALLADVGAFADRSSEKIFERKGVGILATL